MLTTSEAYKVAVKQPQRSFNPLVEVVFNPKVSHVVSVSTEINDNTADVPYVSNGMYHDQNYTMQGAYTAPSNTGWHGKILANVSGVLTIPEWLLSSYSAVITGKHFWVVGRLSNFPVDFTLEVATGAGSYTQIATVTGNTQYMRYVTLDNVVTFDKLRLTITKISSANTTALILEFGHIQQVLFDQDDVADFSVLEESSADNNSIIGTVTANEFSATLRNDDYKLINTNTGSGLSALLFPGIPVNTYLGLQITSGVFEYVSTGKFFMADWIPNNAELSFSISAYDLLYQLYNKDLPLILPSTQTDVRTLLTSLFTALGLSSSQYDIDDTLVDVIYIGYITGDIVGKALQSLSEAGICAIYVTRAGILRVKDLTQHDSYVDTLDDVDDLIDFKNSQNFNGVYPMVQVAYYSPALGDNQSLITIDNLTIPPGGMLIADIVFTDVVGQLTYAMVHGDTGCYISKISTGADRCEVFVSNDTASTQQNVSVEIFGKSVDTSAAVVTVQDDVLISVLPGKVLQINNELIQTVEVAQKQANALLALSSDSKSLYEAETRANPALEIQDVVQVQPSVPLKITDALQLAIVRQELRYNGGIESTLTLRKPLS